MIDAIRDIYEVCQNSSFRRRERTTGSFSEGLLVSLFKTPHVEVPEAMRLSSTSIPFESLYGRVLGCASVHKLTLSI